MLRFLSQLCLLILLAKSEQDRKDDHDPPYQARKKKAPAHRYEKYKHSTEQEHRTAKQYNWRFQNVLTFFAVVFTALAVAFAFKTFTQTRRQADIAQDTERRQLRAYVGLIDAVAVSSPPQVLKIALTAKNFGLTPAYDSGIKWRIETQACSVDGTYRFVDYGAEQQQIRVVIFPNHSWDFMSEMKIPERGIPTVPDGRKCILIYGTLYYEDAFRARRHADFCFFFVPDDARGNLCHNHNGQTPND